MWQHRMTTMVDSHDCILLDISDLFGTTELLEQSVLKSHLLTHRKIPFDDIRRL